MLCPNCKHPQTCPCPSCQQRIPTEKPWIWVNGDTIKCGNCGLEEYEGWWFEHELAQWEAASE